MEPYWVSVLLLTVEGDARAFYPAVDCQHVNVRSADVLRVCAFLVRSMRGRLVELSVSLWLPEASRSEELWRWRTPRPTPMQRKHLAELDASRAARAARLAAQAAAVTS